LFLLALILLPLLGIFLVSSISTFNIQIGKTNNLKIIALAVTIVNLLVSLIIFILFDNSSKHFQFVQEHYQISYYDFYLGVDGLSIYFVLLTTLIMPISIISNWKSIKKNSLIFLILILLLETSLLMVFLVLDILMFYIFFESILAPLFILIGLFGSKEKIRASFYIFLYTLLGSLFMLLSIIKMLSLIGCTDFDVLSKTNFLLNTQIFLFVGIIIAFTVKTPTIYLNSWLLKAHVESPLSGSIILAGIVLKLSLYGIFRLILPLVPKAFLYYTHIIFIIGVLSIIYASLSTLRTVDVKELIAYSSVSHAAVYFLGALSNTLHGIQGAIVLGLAHGFVSSGLFICAGGVLYDRSATRLISYYRGIAQVMPIFSIFFFILSLGNCGAPLTLNFIGEFMCLYGVFERLPVAGILASSSIVFSAAYTIFMYNRISFAGTFFRRFLDTYMSDINIREFYILFILSILMIFPGIYPSIILDGLQYITDCIIYSLKSVVTMDVVHFDTPDPEDSPIESLPSLTRSPTPDAMPIGIATENSIELEESSSTHTHTDIISPRPVHIAVIQQWINTYGGGHTPDSENSSESEQQASTPEQTSNGTALQNIPDATAPENTLDATAPDATAPDATASKNTLDGNASAGTEKLIQKQCTVGSQAKMMHNQGIERYCHRYVKDVISDNGEVTQKSYSDEVQQNREKYCAKYTADPEQAKSCDLRSNHPDCIDESGRHKIVPGIWNVTEDVASRACCNCGAFNAVSECKNCSCNFHAPDLRDPHTTWYVREKSTQSPASSVSSES